MGRGARWLGEIAVDQAVGFATDRVAPTVAPLVDAALYSRNAYRGGRDAYRGLVGVATLQSPRGARFGAAVAGTMRSAVATAPVTVTFPMTVSGMAAPTLDMTIG